MEILKYGIITPSKFVFTFGYTTTDNFSFLYYEGDLIWRNSKGNGKYLY